MVEHLKAGSNLGDYELIKSLGHGGMAEVFLAKHSGIGGFQRLIALKVIHPTHSEDPEFIESLVQEAKVAVQLSHPNIGQVHDLGKVDNVYFIVMDFIDGKDLYRLLFEASQQNRPFPVDVALFIAEQVASGLGYCHERRDHYGRAMNLVHRDVSPQNIFLSWQGEVKILDFGIAKVSHRLRHTEAGVIKGKLQYMSPEQISGGKLDSRSDLFSCGICLFEMLAGEMARGEADPLDLLDRIRRAEFKSLHTLRPELDLRIVQVVERSLSRHPADRFASGEDLSRALQRLRFELFPDFRAARLGEFLLSIFDDSPFYLEDSKMGPSSVLDEDFEQSVSLSSSIIFGDENTELVPGTGENSMIGEDTVNLVSDEVVSQHPDTFVGDNVSPHYLTSGEESGVHGSSMEHTNLYEAPRLDRANPYSDPSTNSGFSNFAPGVRAAPADSELKPDEPAVQLENRRLSQKDHSSAKQPLISQATDYESSAQLKQVQRARSANPFDASVETRGESVRDSKRPFGVGSKLFRSNRTRSNRGVARKFTLGALCALFAYFCIFELPSVLSSKTPQTISLYLTTEPEGARIYLNGQDSRQVTNIEVLIPKSGDSVILLTREGYTPAEIIIDQVMKRDAESQLRIERMVKLVPQ